jgi:hypothetical protein
MGVNAMAKPIAPIELPPSTNPEIERSWLRHKLHVWLDNEYLPEAVNESIADRCAQIFMRHRMEGENDLGELVIAIIIEMQNFNFTESFYGEFTVANAVSDMILESMGFDTCCGY